MNITYSHLGIAIIDSETWTRIFLFQKRENKKIEFIWCRGWHFGTAEQRSSRSRRLEEIVATKIWKKTFKTFLQKNQNFFLQFKFIFRVYDYTAWPPASSSSGAHHHQQTGSSGGDSSKENPLKGGPRCQLFLKVCISFGRSAFSAMKKLRIFERRGVETVRFFIFILC